MATGQLLLCGVFILINCLVGAGAGASTNATGDNFDAATATELGNFSNALGAFALADIQPGDNETTTGDAKNYEPGKYADGEEASKFNTEFLTFTAPDDDDDGDSEQIQELVKLLQPKHVLLIDMPDTEPDVLMVVEEQLDGEKSLNVYVVRREAPDDRWSDQQRPSDYEPAGHLVKHRSLEEAAQEDKDEVGPDEVVSVSAATMSGEMRRADETDEAYAEPSVVFKIATRDAVFYQTFAADECAEAEAEGRQLAA